MSKYAGKTHAKVALSGTDSLLQLKAMDLGVGSDRDIDCPPRGLGMVSMQERARLAGGELKVQSALGRAQP